MAQGDLQRKLGKNLRDRRLALGLTQEQMGENLGYRRNYLGSIELGNRNFTLRSLERLGDMLGEDPRILLED